MLYANGRIGINYVDIDSFARNDSDSTVDNTGGISATVGIWKGSAEAITLPTGKFVPGPHSINGETDTTTRGEARDSYVRLAWDTGGAAWDLGTIDAFSGNGGINSPEANALRDKFIASLGSQIQQAALNGRVVHTEQALVAINYGGNTLTAAQGGFGADGGFTGNTQLTADANTTVDVLKTNSIPRFGSPATPAQQVFQTARTGDTSSSTSNDIHLTFSTLAAGKYVVELYFAEISPSVSAGSRVFDVLLEGRTVLNDYDIFNDRGKDVAFGTSTVERDVAQLSGAGSTSTPAGIVKRFQIDVGSADGAAGLQIDLLAQNGDALINGVRILTPIGDYNRDGNVDCYDYSLWRSTFGNAAPNDLRADGNGNSMVDTADYIIWAHAYNAIMHRPIGDFNNDGTTDLADYGIWRSTFGSTTDLRADANCNGVVDAADYAIWRDTYKSTMAVAQFGQLDAVPPEVLGFELLAGASAFDFTSVVGSGGQLRSVPLAGANSIRITFSQTVTVPQSALQLLNLDGSAPSVTSFAYDSAMNSATWTFASALADGRYLVRLADSVHNSANVALDGEFTNPWFLTQTGTSTFASGNGTAGGEFRFRFTVLAGDTDHNNIHGATNYQNWKSYEPGQAYVSKTSDEFDSDVSFGDFSLREAVNYANTASEPTKIFLPTGTYALTLSGTGGVSQGDLDVTGNVMIVGDGPGLSTIDGSNSASGRILDIANLGVLSLSRVTLATGRGTSNSDQRNGGAVRVNNGGQLHMDHSAIVGSETGGWGLGGGIYFAPTASGSIESSVITVNYGDQQTGGLYLEDASGTGGTVTIKTTIIANNWDGEGTDYPDIYVGANRTLLSYGYNRFTSAPEDDFTLHATDEIGPVDYVVTSIADTYDGSSDPANMSLRDAIDLANNTAGTQEIWLPAWDFVLTRQRDFQTQLTDIDVTFGDLDITDSLVLRGIGGAGGPATSVAWAPGAVADKVFELVGDYDESGAVNAGDYDVYGSQLGQSGPNLAADGNDDGHVDSADHTVWHDHYGITLEMDAIEVG